MSDDLSHDLSDDPSDQPGAGGGAARHQRLRELLGAYVLGQLDPAESDEVQTHLASCAGCSAELAELEVVAGALSALQPSYRAAGAAAVPPADLGDRVLDGIREQRRRVEGVRRRRRVLVGLAAAAAVVVAFGVGLRLGPGLGAPPVRDVALTVTPGVTGEAGLVRHTWGTELKLDATGLTEGAVYTVEFVRDDGRHVSAGGIIGTGPNLITCSVNAALPIDDAAELVIVDPAGATVMSADLS